MAKKDINQLAKSILDIVTGDSEDNNKSKNAALPLKGRAGGLKGGKARADKLTSEERSKIAANAAAKRWGKQL